MNDGPPLSTGGDRALSTADGHDDRIQVQEIGAADAERVLVWSRYHGSIDVGVPNPFRSDCWGRLVTLYRRVGGSGRWKRWGWTCARCGAVWHETP